MSDVFVVGHAVSVYAMCVVDCHLGAHVFNAYNYLLGTHISNAGCLKRLE